MMQLKETTHDRNYLTVLTGMDRNGLSAWALSTPENGTWVIFQLAAEEQVWICTGSKGGLLGKVDNSAYLSLDEARDLWKRWIAFGYTVTATTDAVATSAGNL